MAERTAHQRAAGHVAPVMPARDCAQHPRVQVNQPAAREGQVLRGGNRRAGAHLHTMMRQVREAHRPRMPRLSQAIHAGAPVLPDLVFQRREFG